LIIVPFCAEMSALSLPSVPHWEVSTVYALGFY
jgi:hypothetical protein